jgi:hypothetical protein
LLVVIVLNFAWVGCQRVSHLETVPSLMAHWCCGGEVRSTRDVMVKWYGQISQHGCALCHA